MDHHHHHHYHHHDHNHTGELFEGITSNDYDVNAVLTAKAITMVVLCTVSICMGLIPIELAKCFKWGHFGKTSNPKSSKVVSLLLGFGGGVLFCTTFIHMLPEVQENIQNLMISEKLPSNFPLAEVLVCTGFFIMYLVEEIVHSKLHHHEKDKKIHSEKDVNISTNELVENGENCANGHSHGYGHAHSHLSSAVNTDHHDFVISSLRGLLIVLGLSVHELFEGLAIGLESSANSVWYMFAAVAAHKFVIAFCIGVELLASKTHRWLSVIYICTFAIVSPAGIGIGMILVGGEGAAASGVLPVVLQGIATGTLLYVVFFEILHHNRDGLCQYLSIFIGFILMFGLQIATSHSHSHGHGHGEEHGHSHNLEKEHEDHDHPAAELITQTMRVLSASVDLLVNKTTQPPILDINNNSTDNFS